MTTKPPPSTASPAGVPSGGNGKYIVLVVLLLGVVGGLVYWKKTQADAATAQNPSATVTTTPPPPRPKDDYIPPPPEPEVVPEAGPPPKVNTTTYTATNGCEAKTCSGRNTPDLEAALSARARASKRCYNNALSSDNTLQGKMAISLRIGSNGAVCSANITSNDLGSQQVANCVANTFRQSGFPSPAGGCVEATVPMNFVQQK
jgi:hypothetical protein